MVNTHMAKKKTRWIVILMVLVLFTFWMTVSTAFSSATLTTRYPLAAIEPTLYSQIKSNWCGPSALQSAIQWVHQYNDGIPVATVVPVKPQANLWAYMRDNSCRDLGYGRDTALAGVVGDGYKNVRKMNIAYDFGVDPHAMAWTMWMKTDVNYYYHYWIYDSGPDLATRWLLYTLEKYHEPVQVAVLDGTHWVLVIGYESEFKAYPGDPGTIYNIRIADPWDGLKKWVRYSGSSKSWTSYWFTRYTNVNDPDPATGWYVPPPDHWKNHWVTIERDANSNQNPDHAMTVNSRVPMKYEIFLPSIDTR